MRSGLTAFLNARLDEDEAAAKALTGYMVSEWPQGDPGRVLREVEAKRRILALYTDGDHCAGHSPDYWDGLGQALDALYAVYSDHPDYVPGLRAGYDAVD